MNLRRAIRAAWRLVPPDMKGRATITRPSGSPSSTPGFVLLVPASSRVGVMADTFQALGTIVTKGRRIVLLPDGLLFPPAADMTLTFGGVTYQLVGVAPLDPDGSGAVLYRLIATT